MSGGDLLVRFLTAYKFTLSLDQVRDDPSLSILSKLGIVKDRKDGATALCDVCDFPHSVKIGSDPITEQLGWRCPSEGFVEAKADQLKTVRLSPDMLAEQIASALQCGRRKNVPLIENLLWNIGHFEFSANDVSVYLASRIRDAEDASAIASVLQGEPSLRNGLLLTPHISGTAGLTIAGCRFAELAGVVEIGGNRLSCDQGRIAHLAGVTFKQRSGRPVHPGENQATALIRERYRKAIHAKSQRAEAREVIRILGDVAPKQTKLISIISDVWSDH